MIGTTVVKLAAAKLPWYRDKLSEGEGVKSALDSSMKLGHSGHTFCRVLRHEIKSKQDSRN